MLKLAAALYVILSISLAPGLTVNAVRATGGSQGATLATQAEAVLVGTHQVSDATLAGAATRTMGSDVETGPITLKALRSGDARLDFASSSGSSTEIRNLANGPAGFWAGPDGVVHAMANHNCQTDAAWFFPALSVLSQVSNASLSISYIGQETRNGSAVQHLQVSFQIPGDTSGLLQRLSAEDVYLDASSLLPVAVVFSAHPDNDALTNIPVEVEFSSYQAVKGVQIPYHIQKFLNGTLFLDITVQSAVLNSGLTDADFTAQ